MAILSVLLVFVGTNAAYGFEPEAVGVSVIEYGMFDKDGSITHELKKDLEYEIRAQFESELDAHISFTYIVKIIDKNKNWTQTVNEFSSSGTLQPLEQKSVSFTWTPEYAGTFRTLVVFENSVDGKAIGAVPQYDFTVVPSEENPIPPPLKQMKMGIKLAHIICDKDRYPTWNIHDKPACVFPDSENSLLNRGWAKLRLMLPAGPDPVKELEIMGQNELSYRFTGNLVIGNEEHPLSDDRKRELVWEYSQKHHKDEKYLEYAIVSLQKHYDVGEYVKFDLLEWGIYYDCWNLSVRILDVNDEIVYEDNSATYCLDPNIIEGRGTFHSHSIGDEFEEFSCDVPGFYRIEISNARIFPSDILETFVCLENEN